MLIDWSLESVEGREVVLRLVSIILSISACSGQYPTQETISEMPFGFWYIFQVRNLAQSARIEFLKKVGLLNLLQ